MQAAAASSGRPSDRNRSDRPGDPRAADRATGVVRRIGAVKADRLDDRLAARPAREAVILRGLVAAAGERFPRAVLVRMWRELLAATTRLQTPMSVVGLHPQAARLPHLGSRARPLRLGHADGPGRQREPGAALGRRRQRDGGGPADAGRRRTLVGGADVRPRPRLRVFARLPFVASAAATATRRARSPSAGSSRAERRRSGAAGDRGGVRLSRAAACAICCSPPGWRAGWLAAVARRRRAPDGPSGRGRQLRGRRRRARRRGAAQAGAARSCASCRSAATLDRCRRTERHAATAVTSFLTQRETVRWPG